MSGSVVALEWSEVAPATSLQRDPAHRGESPRFADIAAAGSASRHGAITTPAGAVSNALTFDRSTGGSTPALTTLSPSSAAAGGSAFTLTVTRKQFRERLLWWLERWQSHQYLRERDPAQLRRSPRREYRTARGSAAVTVKLHPR